MRAVVLLALCMAAATATEVSECKDEKFIGETIKIEVSNCDEPPCLLKKNTDTAVAFHFKPTKDIKTLENHVYAVIQGTHLPFVGVHYTDACENIYNEKEEKVTCPLKAGEEYVYKNKFGILRAYPQISFEVYWALKTDDGRSATCFVVPSKIIK